MAEAVEVITTSRTPMAEAVAVITTTRIPKDGSHPNIFSQKLDTQTEK